MGGTGVFCTTRKQGHAKQTNKPKWWEYVKGTQEPTERAPSGKNWKNASNRINKVVLDCS